MGQEIPSSLTRLALHRPAFMGCFCPLCHSVWFLVFAIIASFTSSSIFMFVFLFCFFLCKAFGKELSKNLVCITNHHVILITLLHPADPPQNHCSPCTVNRWRHWRKLLTVFYLLLFILPGLPKRLRGWKTSLGIPEIKYPPGSSLYFLWSYISCFALLS